MESEWDFYLCMIEDRPASIFLDLGLRDYAPLETANELIWVRVVMREPRADGLSSKSELDSLCDVEDALCDIAGANKPPVLYAGRATSDGCRDFYFYGPSRQIEERFAAELQARHDYSFEIGGRNDAEWQAYFRFLYPTPREYQSIQNSRLIRQLEEHGDPLDCAREVQHWIYFENDQQRQVFIRRLPRTGYCVSDEHDEGPTDRPCVVSVVKHHAVDVETVNDEVMRLFDLSCDCEGAYDGWETSVISPNK